MATQLAIGIKFVNCKLLIFFADWKPLSVNVKQRELITQLDYVILFQDILDHGADLHFIENLVKCGCGARTVSKTLILFQHNYLKVVKK